MAVDLISLALGIGVGMFSYYLFNYYKTLKSKFVNLAKGEAQLVDTFDIDYFADKLKNLEGKKLIVTWENGHCKIRLSK